MQAGTSHSAVNGRSKASFPQREQGCLLLTQLILQSVLVSATRTGVSPFFQCLAKRDFMDGSTHGRAVRAAMITSSGFRVVADGIIYTGVTGFAGAKLSSVLCRTSIDSSRSGTDKFVGDVSTVLALMVDFGRTIHDEYFLFFLRFLFVRIFLPTRTWYPNPGSSVGNHFLINGLFI